jgi:hypothetical protein
VAIFARTVFDNASMFIRSFALENRMDAREGQHSVGHLGKRGESERRLTLRMSRSCMTSNWMYYADVELAVNRRGAFGSRRERGQEERERTSGAVPTRVCTAREFRVYAEPAVAKADRQVPIQAFAGIRY